MIPESSTPTQPTCLHVGAGSDIQNGPAIDCSIGLARLGEPDAIAAPLRLEALDFQEPAADRHRSCAELSVFRT